MSQCLWAGEGTSYTLSWEHGEPSAQTHLANHGDPPDTGNVAIVVPQLAGMTNI